jgi:chromosome partitioning protein
MEVDMKSIGFINQKGGVAKTSSTLNIGVGLARQGKSVLLVDFDPQANLTSSFGINPDPQKTVYELLKLQATGKSIFIKNFMYELDIGKKNKLFLIPSTIGLSGLENYIKDHPQKDFLFKLVLQSFNDFDYVLVDCPPSLGLLPIMVLAAVDEVYIPVQPEYFALQGLGQISSVISAVNQTLNPQLKLGGVFGTKYNNRKLHKDVMKYLKENFKGLMFKTLIRDNISIAEAPSYNKDIYSYSPRSNGAKDYTALCKEIIEREI